MRCRSASQMYRTEKILQHEWLAVSSDEQRFQTAVLSMGGPGHTPEGPKSVARSPRSHSLSHDEHREIHRYRLLLSSCYWYVGLARSALRSASQQTTAAQAEAAATHLDEAEYCECDGKDDKAFRAGYIVSGESPKGLTRSETTANEQDLDTR